MVGLPDPGVATLVGGPRDGMQLKDVPHARGFVIPIGIVGGLYEDQHSAHHVHEGNLAAAEWDRVTCLRCLSQMRGMLTRRLEMEARRLLGVSERHDAVQRRRRRATR